MSQLLEKLRRAAEVFADPIIEEEGSDDENGVKAKEKVVHKTTGKLRSRAQPCVRHAERLFSLSMYK